MCVQYEGCHDNGYVTSLRSQITAGFKQKIILMQNYTDMAAGVSELELPAITIPGLFLTQKLGSGPTNISSVPVAALGVPPAAVQTPPLASVPVLPPGLVQGPSAASTVTSAASIKTLPSAPSTYSSAAQACAKRPPTPDLDSSSDVSSDDSNDDLPFFRTQPTPTLSRSRHVNPNTVSADAPPLES